MVLPITASAWEMVMFDWKVTLSTDSWKCCGALRFISPNPPAIKTKDWLAEKLFGFTSPKVKFGLEAKNVASLVIFTSSTVHSEELFPPLVGVS